VPELPEVETVRRLCEQHLVGRSISAIDVRLPKITRDSPIPNEEVLLGATLVAARRRAKVLTLDFSNAFSLMVHFKLAGQWAIFLPDGTRHVAGHPHPKPDGEYPHKATHATITLSDGTVVHYSDIRQFGWWRIMHTDVVEPTLQTFGFGPEAVDELDARALAEGMSRRGIAVKALLLDQSFIAGLGNIYVDEVLWRARIHPAARADMISTVKRREIIQHIPDVMTEGIRQGGAKIISTIAHPVDNFPAIHGREGQPCLRCGTSIQKLRVAQRGTYICPKCQKLPRPAITG
jgi:formamidopyrimidine-DNA glycosylase